TTVAKVPSTSTMVRSEKVPDRELEQIRLVRRPLGQREPRLEPQRPQRREPTDPETRRVEQPQGQRPAPLLAGEEVLAVVESVAGVVEHNAAHAGRLDQRELD